MQRLFAKPKLVYVGLVVALVGFFALSAVGNTSDTAKKTSSVTWIGDIGWTLFLLSVLATILYTVALLVRTIVRRRRSSVA